MSERSLLSANLERDLLKYLVAGAGAIACTQSTNAAVVYSGPISSPVPSLPGILDITFSNSPQVNFALFKTACSCSTSRSAALLLGLGPQTAALTDGFNVTPLGLGAPIGPSGSFGLPGTLHLLASAYAAFSRTVSTTTQTVGSSNGTTHTVQQTHQNTFFSSAGVSGPLGLGQQYIGFKFQVNSEDYFGWALIDVTDLSANANPLFVSVSADLLGFAFESCPGTPIGAGDTAGGADCASTASPEPGSAPLLMLAAGVLGLGEWRRRKKAA